MCVSSKGFTSNDATEIDYGCALVREVLTSKRESGCSEIISSFLDYATGAFNPYEHLSVFVTCFCARDDLLSQWRGYGGKELGFSIGFSSGALANHPDAVTKRQPLVKVLYDRDEQRGVIERVLDPIISTLSRVTTGMSPVEAVRLIHEGGILFRELLATRLASFKHPGFEEEQEWRIVTPCYPLDTECPVSFRSTLGMLAPYRELDLCWWGEPWPGRLPIVSVRHGPTPHPKFSEEAIRLLLHKAGYLAEKTEVLGSSVPLRA